MHTMHFTPPPRRVPLSLRVINLFNGITQIGWFVFGFGMIFFWVFAGNADFSFLTFRGAMEYATGRVVESRSTGASENDQSVQANHYQFSVAGQSYNGTSYSLGGGAAQGDEVTIEYDPDDPSRSRIEGMRRNMFGPWAAVVSIFPLIGLGFVVPFTLKGIQRNRLLRDGILTQGTLIHKGMTNVRINHRPVWELTFEFTDRLGQRHEAKARSVDTSRLEDESSEPLLYDPNDPSRAYVLDEAPARPKFEMNGEMIGRGGGALMRLVLPGIVIGANVLVLLSKLQ
jgi:hypothetical protein